MTTSRRQIHIRLMAEMVQFCYRQAKGVTIGAIMLTVLCLYYIGGHLSISTDFDALLSDRLAFTRLHADFKQAFPRQGDTIVIIIDGNSADLAEYGIRKFSDWFAANPDVADDLLIQGDGRFFRQNGLLYLDRKELESVAGRIIEMQAPLAQLARDPGLPRLARLVGEALDRDASGEYPAPAALGALMDSWSDAIYATERGKFFLFPWSEIMTGEGSSGQARRRLIEVTPHLEGGAFQPAGQSIMRIRKAVHDLGLTPNRGIRVRLTGSAMLDYEQLQGAMQAAGFVTALAGLLILMLLFIAIRNLHLVLAVVTALGMSLIWTTAFAIFTTSPLNIISISFAVLFLGMGVDFSIQFCLRCQQEASHDADLEGVFYRTSTGLGTAMSLSALAAGISFLSFTPTAYRGLADLGLIAGAGMFIALIATLTILPALMTLMGVPTGQPQKRRFPPSLQQRRTGAFIARRARTICTVALALAMMAIIPASALQFDFNPLHLLNEESPAVKAFRDLAATSKASPYAIEIISPSLQEAGRIATTLKRQDSVERVVTLNSLVPDRQEEKIGIIRDLAMLVPSYTLQVRPHSPSSATVIHDALSRLEKSLAIYAQHAGGKPLAEHASRLSRSITDLMKHPRLFTRLESNVINGLAYRINTLATSLTARRVGIDNLPATLKRRFLTPDGRARIEVYSSLDLDDHANLVRFVQQVRAVAPRATGDPVMMVDGGHTVAMAFVEASTIALLLVVLLLTVSLGSIRESLTVLVPLSLAALLMAGSMSMLGQSLNLANVIVLPLLAGLGVSYGIYLVLLQRTLGIEGLFASVTPRAIMFSALTTMCSFGSLAISGDTAMASLGKSLAIALAWVLASNLIVQPALLSLGPAERARQR